MTALIACNQHKRAVPCVLCCQEKITHLEKELAEAREVIETARGLVESYRNLSWLFIREHMAGQALHGEGCMPCKDAYVAEHNVTKMLDALARLDEGEGKQ